MNVLNILTCTANRGVNEPNLLVCKLGLFTGRAWLTYITSLFNRAKPIQMSRAKIFSVDLGSFVNEPKLKLELNSITEWVKPS